MLRYTSLNEILREINRTQPIGGRTNTAAGLRFMREQFTRENGDR